MFSRYDVDTRRRKFYFTDLMFDLVGRVGNSGLIYIGKLLSIAKWIPIEI